MSVGCVRVMSGSPKRCMYDATYLRAIVTPLLLARRVVHLGVEKEALVAPRERLPWSVSLRKAVIHLPSRECSGLGQPMLSTSVRYVPGRGKEGAPAGCRRSPPARARGAGGAWTQSGRCTRPDQRLEKSATRCNVSVPTERDHAKVADLAPGLGALCSRLAHRRASVAWIRTASVLLGVLTLGAELRSRLRVGRELGRARGKAARGHSGHHGTRGQRSAGNHSATEHEHDQIKFW